MYIQRVSAQKIFFSVRKDTLRKSTAPLWDVVPVVCVSSYSTVNLVTDYLLTSEEFYPRSISALELTQTLWICNVHQVETICWTSSIPSSKDNRKISVTFTPGFERIWRKQKSPLFPRLCLVSLSFLLNSVWWLDNYRLPKSETFKKCLIDSLWIGVR